MRSAARDQRDRIGIDFRADIFELELGHAVRAVRCRHQGREGQALRARRVLPRGSRIAGQSQVRVRMSLRCELPQEEHEREQCVGSK